MNYQDKVNYLKNYQDMYYRLEYINGQIEKIRSPHLGEVLGGSKSLSDYLDEKDVLIKKMAEIEAVINKVVDYKSRLVLKYRFLEFKTLEEIGEIMHFSVSHLYRVYNNALKSYITLKNDK